ncbi:FRG domain-containing protein [Seonamhaeicola sediminis]|uniref:FRG domain-containing protein n=1 Tax=Seonamhaeicola sediminis TaxID=2528206 RepID=A0A562Y7L6_9FLAO|nr:FRG domain-containing protein [Seonamhaeicola sediminis]TWO30421.1 FRG domain-containing protein [Seonamhaeicola sediminis]
MGKTIPFYNTIEDKEKHFKIIEINTEQDFDNFFDEHQNKEGIYRGVSSWRYKIYSSLQRHLMSNEITIEDSNRFINDYIKICRQNPLLNKYLNSFKIPPSKLSLMAYLQHFGAPTSFIDFSENISKSLYFATEKLKNDTIENFSLYFIDKKDLELINIDNVYDGVKKRKNYFDELSKVYEEKMDSGRYHNINDEMFDINVLDVFLIENKVEYEEIFKTYNNIRIIAQEGLFINNSHLKLPLEESLKHFFSNSVNYQWSPIEETPEAENYQREEYARIEKCKPLQKRLENNIIISYEFSPKLVEYVKKKIKLNKEDIYPEEEKLVQELFNKHLETIKITMPNKV